MALAEEVEVEVIGGAGIPVGSALGETVEALLELAGLVVESAALELLRARGAFDDSLPLVGLTALANNALLVGFLTTEELAGSFVSPHVDLVSDLAPWNLS